jgi:hypothetical protein
MAERTVRLVVTHDLIVDGELCGNCWARYWDRDEPRPGCHIFGKLLASKWRRLPECIAAEPPEAGGDKVSHGD